MKALLTVRTIPWRFSVFTSVALGLFAGHLSAAPSKRATDSRVRASTPTPAPANAGSKAAADRPPAADEGGAPTYADAFPTNVPATPDLQLDPQAAKQAEAFAAFGRAIVAEDAADTELALRLFRKALDFDASYAELAVKVAFELARREDPSAGIQILKDAIKASPKEPLPQIYLSQLYSKHLNKPDLARKHAEAAVALAPDYFPSHLALFELLVAQGQAKEAEAVLQKAGQSRSTQPEYWLQLGELSVQTYLAEDGAAKNPDAINKLNVIFAKAQELGKENASVLARVGNFYVETNQVGAAIPVYLAALEKQPSANDPVLANVREKLARALLESGKRDEAIAHLEKITQEAPLSYEVYELLGELYEQAGNISKAIACYQHNLLLDARDPRNHMKLVDMQLQSGLVPDALSTAESARRRFPDDPKTIYLHAIVLSEAKKHTEAMTAFAEALAEFENGYDDYLDTSFYFRYGIAAERAGRHTHAADLLKRAIDLNPSGPEPYNYLGYMWVDRGENLDEAGELIKKAVEMSPENGSYLDSLGWFHFKKGQYEEALALLQKAASHTTPESAEIFDHIGDTYQQLGKKKEALEYWKRALTLAADPKMKEQLPAGIDERLKEKIATHAPSVEMSAAKK